MKPLERSEGAKGRITFAVSDVITNDPNEDANAVYKDYIDKAQTEVLSYESGKRQNIEGGLSLLFRTTFKSKMVRVFKDYVKLDPVGIENLLINLWKNIEKKSLQDIAKSIQDNRWDILLLLNGKGTSLHFALLMEAFIQEQGNTLVTTIATSAAKSGHAMLFGIGERRIALPSTKLLLHDAINNRTGSSAIDDSVPELKQHFSKKMDDVIDKTIERTKEILDMKFKKQQDSKNHRREIQWEGRESPGYITDYLSEEDPLPGQIATVIGRPINLAEFQTDVVARFALESEAEKRMRKEGHNISVFSIRDQWKIMGEKVGKVESDRFQKIVMELMSESGHANAKIKSNDNT